MKKKSHFLNRISIIILLYFCLASCGGQKVKGDYLQTIKTCNNLYVEVYRTFGSGAFGSDLVDEYLTDLTTFRVRIGTVDQYNGVYHYKCQGDSIVIFKTFKSDSSKESKIVETNSYGISDLKKLKNISNSTITNIRSK